MNPGLTNIPSKGEIIIYQTKDKKVQLEVKLEQETVWLMQAQIATLFGTQLPAITKHLNNIFISKELEENLACSILEHAAKDGKIYQAKFYNPEILLRCPE